MILPDRLMVNRRALDAKILGPTPSPAAMHHSLCSGTRLRQSFDT